MQQLKGVFYHFNYYILPEDTTVEQLRGSVSLQKLCVGSSDLGSIPPYFIDSLIEKVTVNIDNPNHLAPCDVFVCSEEEYYVKLRALVTHKCKGCLSYGNDPEDLSGHYREMDLDGLCYLRQQKDDKLTYYEVLRYLIERIQLQFPAIKRRILKGNDKKLSKIFNKELSHVMFPVELFGRVEDGNYVLYARACTSVPEYALDLQFLAQVFNDTPSFFTQNGWRMEPCLKGGVAKYKGKTKLNNQSKVAYFTECGEGGQSELRIFIPPKFGANERKVHQYVDDIEKYLTCLVGEEKYFAWYNIRAIESDVALTTLGEVADAINRYYDKQPPIPFPKMFEIDLSDGKNMSGAPLPNREKILQLVSNAPNLATMTQEDLKNDGPPTLWLSHYTFGYIYVPKLLDATALTDDLLWHFDSRNNVETPHDKSNLTFVCGHGVCADGGYIIDFLLPSKNKALARFRGILPVLKKYDAQITLVDESCKVDTYLCGDKLQKLN